MPTFAQTSRLIAGLAALLLSAQLAGAQETAAPAVDPTLSMGTNPTAAPALKTEAEAEVGDLYLAASFDEWQQRCVKSADGSDPCRLYQLLKTADGNPTVEISIFNLPAGGPAAAGAAVLVPLDTLLSANLSVGVDANKPMIYPYTVCGTDGCIARIGFSADQIAQMKGGGEGILMLVPAGAPTQQVTVKMSLKGFTAGFDAVTAANTR